MDNTQNLEKSREWHIAFSIEAEKELDRKEIASSDKGKIEDAMTIADKSGVSPYYILNESQDLELSQFANEIADKVDEKMKSNTISNDVKQTELDINDIAAANRDGGLGG